MTHPHDPPTTTAQPELLDVDGRPVRPGALVEWVDTAGQVIPGRQARVATRQVTAAGRGVARLVQVATRTAVLREGRFLRLLTAPDVQHVAQGPPSLRQPRHRQVWHVLTPGPRSGTMCRTPPSDGAPVRAWNDTLMAGEQRCGQCLLMLAHHLAEHPGTPGGPVVDANGDAVPLAPGVDPDDPVLRAWMAGRVPAPACPHYIAVSEARAGLLTCERCVFEAV